MIKNIIFDLGGVIITLDRERCLNAFAKTVGVLDFGEYLNAYAQKGFFAAFENGDITAAQFRDEVRKISTKKELSDEQIDFALNAFLSEIKPEKIKLLFELKKKYNLYLLSNTNPIAWQCSQEIFKQSAGISMEEMFDILFRSYQMKKSKPGRAIFQQVLDESGVKAEETLFIDDASANIQTAAEMHFKTLLYDVNKELTGAVLEALQHD